MKKQSHFDRRGATYDRDELHHRIVALLIKGAEIKPGWSILDIATGTGILALEAAQQVGPSGKVIGVDLSKGMLAEAQQKAAATKLSNIEFVQHNAEQLAFPHESFDCIFCSSAIVLMSDIPLALRHWFNFLKPRGLIAFDTPAKPFGMSQRVVDIAARYGIHLAYADIVDTPTKCRLLLEESGFEVIDVRTEFTNSRPIELGKAIAFWDERIDHPAWEPLGQAQPKIRETMRTEYIDSVTADAVAGYVPNDTALNFAFGRKRS